MVSKGTLLLVAKNTTGYYGVYHHRPGKPKPYTARVSRGGKLLHLGYFATAEEAALCVGDRRRGGRRRRNGLQRRRG